LDSALSRADKIVVRVIEARRLNIAVARKRFRHAGVAWCSLPALPS
jgi:hypothetical protein